MRAGEHQDTAQVIALSHAAAKEADDISRPHQRFCTGVRLGRARIGGSRGRRGRRAEDELLWEAMLKRAAEYVAAPSPPTGP